MNPIEVIGALAAASAIITDCIQNYQVLSKPPLPPTAVNQPRKTLYKKTRAIRWTSSAFVWTTEVKEVVS
jgi:hypothetical protein